MPEVGLGWGLDVNWEVGGRKAGASVVSRFLLSSLMFLRILVVCGLVLQLGFNIRGGKASQLGIFISKVCA